MSENHKTASRTDGKGRAAILGGGITGLTLAFELSRLGYEVELFEASPQPGGLASTFEWDGFRFDYGPHEFCTDSPALIDFLRDVLGGDFLIRKRHACQYYLGHEIAYPFNPLGLFFTLGPGRLMKTASEIFVGRMKNIFWQQENYTFRSWAESRYGKTLYNEYFGPYTKKVWGIEPMKLDPRTASSRIAFNSVFDYMFQYMQFLFHKENYENPHSPMKSGFFFARRGIGTLCDRLAERAAALGARIHTAAPVTAVKVAGGRVESIEAGGRTVDGFDVAVSTIPLPDLLEMLGYRMPMLYKYRSMALVFLKVPLPRLRDWLWVYFPDPAVVFQRMSEFSNFDADMCPPGHTGLCAEISYFEGDEIDATSDEALVERTVADLRKTGFLPEGVRCEGTVKRIRHAYPIQYVGFIEWVSMMMEPVSRLGNLVLAGRQALYRYANMNECMEIAIDTAAAIARGETKFDYSPVSNWVGAGVKRK